MENSTQTQDFISFAEKLGYGNAMYLPQTLKDCIKRAMDECEYEATLRSHQSVREVLNSLNDELFHSTVEPSGQFIKDMIFKRLDQLN